MIFDRLRPLFPYLRRYRGSFGLGGIALVFYNGAKASIPLLVGGGIDRLRRGGGTHELARDAGLLIVAAAVAAVMLYLARQILIGASREIEFDLRNDMFAHLETQPPSFFHRHRTGDIMARSTNDLNAVRMLLGPAIMYSVNTVFFMAAALPFMLHISTRLTWIAFVPLPFASVLVQFFGAKIHARFERIQAMFSDISAQAEENFSGARLIRAFAQEEAQIAAFEESNAEYIRRSLHLARLMAMLWPTLELVLGVSLMLTLLVGGREVVSHRITVGQFTSYNVYMVQLTWPMIAIGWVVNLFQRGTASVARIHQLILERPSIDDSGADSSLTEMHGEIEFRDLHLSYATGPEVLHGISLHIPAGSSLALVGPTGSGKSTLISLIPRLHDAPPGEVLLDGHPIREWSLESLRHAIGFVPQETFLFSETVRENIAFGAPEATDESILAAARTAHIGDEILAFPRAFQTVVGERGMTLSGGQKQRSAIARALLRDPRILILDDALASVDTYTEEQILSGLREAMQGRTTILIAHRVSTARSADRIAVLENGRVTALGTHEQLLTRGGYYADLVEKQSLEEEILSAS